MAKVSAGHIMIMAKGDFNSAEEYVPLNLVRYQKKNWLCKRPCTGVYPAEGNFWHEMVVAEIIDSVDFNEQTRILSLMMGDIVVDSVKIPGGEVPIVTEWSDNPSNKNIPSENLVKTSLDEKLNKSGGEVSGVIKPNANDTINLGALDKIFHYGFFKRLFGVNSISASASGNQITVPEKAGTMALTSDIPTVPPISNLTGSDEYNATTTYGPVGNTSGFPSYCIANGRVYECLVQVKGAKPALNGGTNWKWLSLSELNSNISNKILDVNIGKIGVGTTRSISIPQQYRGKKLINYYITNGSSSQSPAQSQCTGSFYNDIGGTFSLYYSDQYAYSDWDVHLLLAN